MNNHIAHPSHLLDANLVAELRRHIPAAEKEARLLPAQLEILKQKNWLQLFVPAQYGGLQLTLPQAVRLEEAIAFADGSIGWVVTLCAGAAMFVGYLQPSLASEVFSAPDAWLAGSGQVGGTATITDIGYLINGEWPYSSGAPHATWFTANCFIEKKGEALFEHDGSKMVRSFLFKRSEVLLRHDWEYIGLNATAGHAYSVENLQVPANRSFVIDALHAQLPHTVYKYPFLQLAETTLAANIAGMGGCFLEAARQLLETKSTTYKRAENVKAKGLQLLQTAEIDIQKIRNIFYDALDSSYKCLEEKKSIPEALLLQVSESSRRLAKTSLQWADHIYPYCGLEAARTQSAINQIWRNLHTASQHSLLLDEQ